MTWCLYECRDKFIFLVTLLVVTTQMYMLSEIQIGDLKREVYTHKSQWRIHNSLSLLPKNAPQIYFYGQCISRRHYQVTDLTLPNKIICWLEI
jgi:hypothetical protein